MPIFEEYQAFKGHWYTYSEGNSVKMFLPKKMDIPQTKSIGSFWDNNFSKGIYVQKMKQEYKKGCLSFNNLG